MRHYTQNLLVCTLIASVWTVRCVASEPGRRYDDLWVNADESRLRSPATAAGRGGISADERLEKLLWVNGVGIGLITVWGVINWDYFTRSPHAESEGWFDNDTSSGGQDKLGHLYSSYVASHGLAALYEYWGFSRDAAAWHGAWSSWIIMGYMEFGDSFSDYGFAGEDMVANTVGCTLGYFLYVHPGLQEKVDLRAEYGLDPNQGDVLTDYENLKYLAALKLNGFEACRESWLRHIELHAGYYARGFEDDEPDRDRKSTRLNSSHYS